MLDDVGVRRRVHAAVDVELAIDLDRLEVARDRGGRGHRGRDVGLGCAGATEHDPARVIHAHGADPERIGRPGRAGERAQCSGPALGRHASGREGDAEDGLGPDLVRAGDRPRDEARVRGLGPAAGTDRGGPVARGAEPADERRAGVGEGLGREQRGEVGRAEPGPEVRADARTGRRADDHRRGARVPAGLHCERGQDPGMEGLAGQAAGTEHESDPLHGRHPSKSPTRSRATGRRSRSRYARTSAFDTRWTTSVAAA